MVNSVSSAAVARVAADNKSLKAQEQAQAQAQQQKADAAKAKNETKKAVPTLDELQSKAFMQRQQIGAALYDRSFTFNEGARALKRQDAVAAYAQQVQAKAGGPTERDLRILDRKLDNAQKQIDRLATNDKGADLDSIEGIDGKELDTVQDNLMARIKAGLKDGSLTEAEGKGLLARQDELNALEAKFRESGGKLTAGEQKMVLDELRKEADKVNALRHNNDGVNRSTWLYSDSVDARQAALEKQLEAGIKAGTLTEQEVTRVREQFDIAQALENELRLDKRVDWRDATKMSTALNNVEISLYELQRNTQGKQLAESYVDVKYVDQRQAQQLESITRGIDNRSLTDVEAVETLKMQQQIQNQEDRLVGNDGKLDRAEYLRLQNSMNDFALRNQELQANSARWTGLLPNPVKVAPPVSSLPPASGGNGNGNGAGGSNGVGNGAGGVNAGGNGNGNGNGGVTNPPAGVAPSPTPGPVAPPVVGGTGNGGSNGNGSGNGGSNGVGNGAGGVNAGGNGNGNGNGGVTNPPAGVAPSPTPGPAVQPPVVQPPVAPPVVQPPVVEVKPEPTPAPVAPPKAEEPKKQDVASGETKSSDVAGTDADGNSSVKPRDFASDVEDIFGKLMSKAMRDATDRVNEFTKNYLEKVRERADERREESRNEVKDRDSRDEKPGMPDFGNPAAAKAYGKQPEAVAKVLGKVA